MRIDKYLWFVRLAKTRSLATKLCQANKVLLNGSEVKPSKEVCASDKISIRVNPIWKEFKVLDFPQSRVGAKLVADYLLEITPEENRKKLEEFHLNQRYNKSLGLKGRPTKKDRRDISDFTN